MTNDEAVQNSLLRLHGFNLMSHILKEYPSDIRIITLVRFSSLRCCPLVAAS
jgi:hypothetical protein